MCAVQSSVPQEHKACIDQIRIPRELLKGDKKDFKIIALNKQKRNDSWNVYSRSHLKSSTDPRESFSWGLKRI